MASTSVNFVHPLLNGREKTGTGKLVLVTGGSGFVAAHVLISFLEAGYRVRTTVRSQDTAERVKKSHAKYVDQIEFAIVPDIGTPGAFDEAVKGVDGVIHTASPFVLQVEDNKRDLLDPAVNGTTNILKSVQQFGAGVKRVVITSSFASIIDLDKGFRGGYTYTEKDWNPVTYEFAANKETPNIVSYCASKTFAERAGFVFVEEHKPSFDVSTLCPPMVYGPIAHSVPSADKLNTSAGDFFRLMDGSTKETPPTQFFAYVDVRDLGFAHLLSFESPKAAHQRYFTTAGNFSYQEFIDVLGKELPELSDRLPKGQAGTLGMGELTADQVYKVSNQKSVDELGLSYYSMKDTVVDSAKSLFHFLP